MEDETWTDKMDRVGRAVWQLLHSQTEVDHVRAEAHLGREGDPQVLSTDAAGGVLWLDMDGKNHRQIILPDGSLARNAEWLAERRKEGPASS
jgi:hypothetical protein